MKKIFIILFICAMVADGQSQSWQNTNVILTNPSGYPFGFNINTNFAGNWAREFSFSRNSSGKLFSFGAYGTDGNLNYGYIGGNSTQDIVHNSPWMVFMPNGNIGIGTTAPGQKFTVQGVIRSQRSASNYVNQFFVSSDGNAYMNYAGGSTSSRIGFQIDGGSQVSIYNNGNFVVHSGNVGIGYNNPAYKLSVDGVISAREVKVSNTPNSDYVFEPDYPLLPLSEVETHIKEKKHLPGIPSAEEFKQNGVGLGEMDDMLLRKVEELTLYVIEQNKDTEKLLESIAELKRENAELKKENDNQNMVIESLIKKQNNED